ncbi:MAG: hypothetical protein ACO241_06720, partial [Burkholderiaceae bacterium]
MLHRIALCAEGGVAQARATIFSSKVRAGVITAAVIATGTERFAATRAKPALATTTELLLAAIAPGVRRRCCGTRRQLGTRAVI